MVEPVTIVLGAGAIAINAYGAFQYYKSRELLREKQLAKQEQASASRASAIKNALDAETHIPTALKIQASASTAKDGASVDPKLLEAIDSAMLTQSSGADQSVSFEEKPIFPGNPVQIPNDAFEKAFKELSDDWDKKVAQTEAEEKAEAKQAGTGTPEEEIAESELFEENSEEAEQDGGEEGDGTDGEARPEEELKTAHKELILRELAPYQKTISELSKKVEKLEGALEKSIKTQQARPPAKRK